MGYYENIEGVGAHFHVQIHYFLIYFKKKVLYSVYKERTREGSITASHDFISWNLEVSRISLEMGWIHVLLPSYLELF